MRLLYVYDGEWPRGATRVIKQTRAMADAGYEVLLLARSCDHSTDADWMTVRRLPEWGGAALHRMLSFPFFLSPLWLRSIAREARDWRASGIFVEDLPLAPAAIWAGRALQVPVFYDMGEVYPEFLRGLWQFGKPTLVDRIVRNPTAATLVERYVLREADHTFVVSTESHDRAVKEGADQAKLTIVGNTPEDLNQLTEAIQTPADLQFLGDRPVVLFTGILIFDRGIQTAVEAIGEVAAEIPDVAFVIVGDGPEAPKIREEVRSRNLQNNVYLLGWKDHSCLPGYYQRASIGLLPFLDGGQIRYTLANKLFDYMGAGLPVVASDVPPMRRILTEGACGLLAPPADPKGLATAIVTLLRYSDQDRRSLGERGQRLVQTTYNWTNDKQSLTCAIQRFLPLSAE